MVICMNVLLIVCRGKQHKWMSQRKLLLKRLKSSGLEEGKTTKISKIVKSVAEKSEIKWFRGRENNKNK